MTKAVMLIPVGYDVGLPTIGMGLQHSMAQRGVKITQFTPIETLQQQQPSTNHVMDIQALESHLSHNQLNQVLELVLQAFETQCKDHDVIIVQGLMAKQSGDYALKFNVSLAQALNTAIIFVSTPGHHSAASLANQIEISARQYRQAGCQRVLGCIINKVFAPVDQDGAAHLCIGPYQERSIDADQYAIELPQVKLLAKIPWQEALIAPRLSDIMPHLNATIVHRGDATQRRVHSMRLCARSVNNMTSALKTGTLIITAGDRHDIILATAMAALNGTQLAGLLLTGGYGIDKNIYALCEQAFQTGLPIFSVSTDSFRTCQNLQNITLHTPADDHEKQHLIEEGIGQYLTGPWLDEWLASEISGGMNQAAFRYHLVQQAMANKRHIILPEGDEPRTLAAACECQQRGIAQITLLGSADKIAVQAKHVGLELPSDINIIDPQQVYRQYIDDLIALRQHKGMNKPIAEEQLQDPLVLGTMMLQKGEVDGLVAGARNPTANVLRPALQLIKTAPDAIKVSSVFFMCFPNQVLVFGDCAVNPNPDVEVLADIAMQSAATAQRFGIEPRVAMISYSTGQSARGEEVARVRAATELVKQKAPDIIIDGPLQYDAAIIPAVAKQKAPDSPLKGQATVLIFPDLNTGNTTYKAVQRSAHLLCIGPMLQGLNKPINDLSRGASIEDIIYTIALTARQAH